jgi:hypothetical protein
MYHFCHFLLNDFFFIVIESDNFIITMVQHCKAFVNRHLVNGGADLFYGKFRGFLSLLINHLTFENCIFINVHSIPLGIFAARGLQSLKYIIFTNLLTVDE